MYLWCFIVQGVWGNSSESEHKVSWQQSVWSRWVIQCVLQSLELSVYISLLTDALLYKAIFVGFWRSLIVYSVGSKVKGVDLEAPGNINGVPVLEVDMESFEEKPWRKPGVY